MRRRRSADSQRRHRASPPRAASASCRYASANTGMRSRYPYRRVDVASPGCGRPPRAPSPRTPATRCRPATSLRSSGGFFASSRSRYSYARASTPRVDVVLQVGRGLEHVQHVAVRYGDTRLAVRRASTRSRRSDTGSSPARGSVCCTVGRSFAGSMPGQRERVAEVGGEHHCQRRASPLLRAAVRVLDEIARAFAEPDQRGGCQLDVQAAEARHDAGRDRQRLGGGRLASDVSPYAATVSGEASTSTGITSSNASVSFAEPRRHLHAGPADAPCPPR